MISGIRLTDSDDEIELEPLETDSESDPDVEKRIKKIKCKLGFFSPTIDKSRMDSDQGLNGIITCVLISEVQSFDGT